VFLTRSVYFKVRLHEFLWSCVLGLRINPAELPYSSTAIEFHKVEYLKNQHFAYAFCEIMLSLRAFPHRFGIFLK
jgi:hypothetical protein